MRRRITIETTHCKRCGKLLATASRSLYGLDTLKAKYGNICQDCITPDELVEMNDAIGKGIINA